MSGRRPIRRGDAPVLAALVLLGLAAIALSPHLTGAPDGLEAAATDLGLAAADEPVLSAPAPDYRWPGLGSGGTATLAAGVGGAVAVYLVAAGLARLLGRRRRDGCGS